MNRVVIFLLAIALLAGALIAFQLSQRSGADESSEATPGKKVSGAQTALRTTGNTPYVRPDYYPSENPYGGLSLNTIETLREYKKRFEITRDEYWKESGGVLANNHFEVWYPPGRVAVTHGMRVFMEIMPARERCADFFGRAPEDQLVIYAMSELDVFKKVTGREWWFYSEISQDTMTMQPVFHLVKRGIVHVAIPHEYHQWAISKLSRGGAPRWVEEGLASYLAREHLLLQTQVYEFPARNDRFPVDELEGVLATEEARDTSRRAYYYSWRMIQALVDEYGEDKVRDMVLRLGEGYPLEGAFETAFGEPYDQVMAVATGYVLDLNPN